MSDLEQKLAETERKLAEAEALLHKIHSAYLQGHSTKHDVVQALNEWGRKQGK